MSEPFDRVVSGMDGAMVVVTTVAAGERAGCLVGFHSQASINPRLYAVWLSKANRTYEVASLARHLAVHALAADQHDVAALFGGTTGDDIDKFGRCEWVEGPGGVPLLARCPNRLVLGRLVILDVGGDHSLFVGAPVHVDTDPAGWPEPLRLSRLNDIEPGHRSGEAS